MKIRGVIASFITLFAVVFFSPTHAIPRDGFPLPVSPRLHYLPGELLVKYKPRVVASAIASSLSQSGVEIKRRYEGIGIHHLRLPAKMSVDEAVRTFMNDPSVEYAEPNYVRHVASTIPDDAFFSDLWGLHNTGQNVEGTSGTPGDDIHAPEAWEITKGNRAIIIAVIDSGVDYNHPDLAGNISSDLRYDFMNGDGNPMDPNDHGTHVAGTIAAVGNNGAGVTGVCWTATIMPLRAGDAFGVLSVSAIVSAIDYAINNGARIINASYRGTDYSKAEYDAISSARNAGILMVAAAGNEASNNDTKPGYPASYKLDNIIAVAATDQNDNLAYFSNYGAGSVHVAAPGVDIYGAKPARQILWSADFDSGSISGWTTGTTNNTDTWGLSTVIHKSGSYSLAVNPAGNYLNNSNSWAQAPVRDLSASVGSKLDFVFTGKSGSDSDLLYVETSTDGLAWTGQDIYVTDNSGAYVNTYPGISGDGSDQWYGATVDLGAYDGKSAVHIRFCFVSNNASNYIGWFIDDIRVTAASSAYSGAADQYYQYLNGTSMATPHVTGLAALIWGFKPSLTYAQVKSIILNSVDANNSLTGKTISGGRVNAESALYHVAPQTPGSLVAAVFSTGAITLTWTDSSLNESGFHIERKTGSGTYALISSADKNSTTYGDRGLSAATTYCYRIASFNDGGNSDYSNPICATTPVPDGGGGDGGSGGGGGCFIATAAFGSPLEPHVQILRNFRDRYLLGHGAGKRLVGIYYRISPPLAGIISKNDTLRTIARWCLMPCIGAAYLTIHHGPLMTLAVFTILVLFMISLRRLFRP